MIEPLDYAPFANAMNKVDLILTDSGGVQEEAPALGKPVLVLRENTERPEAVEAGTVLLVGSDRQRIYDTALTLLTDEAAYAKCSRPSILTVMDTLVKGSSKPSVITWAAQQKNRKIGVRTA